MPQAPVPELSPAHRAGCACGAVITTAGLAIALLGAFFQTAAPPLWLDKWPDLAEQDSHCATLPPCHGCKDCLQNLDSTRLEDLRRCVQVADRATSGTLR